MLVLLLTLGLWIINLEHYQHILSLYAEIGYYLSHPILYVAVESWFLLSELMIFFLVYKIVKLLEERRIK